MSTLIKNYHRYNEVNIASISLKRSDKKLIVSNKEIALNDLFQKLEVKRDKNGKILDTRFPPAVQEYIRYYLASKRVDYKYTGYLSLRGAYQRLSDNDKLQLCININSKFDYGLNIEHEMENAKGFFDAFKTASALTLGGAAIGTMAGATMNLVKPDLIPNMVGEASKNAIAKKLDSPEFRKDLEQRITGAINDYLDNNADSLIETAKTASGELITQEVPNLADSLVETTREGVAGAVKDSVSGGVIGSILKSATGLLGTVTGQEEFGEQLGTLLTDQVSSNTSNFAGGTVEKMFLGQLQNPDFQEQVTDLGTKAVEDYLDENKEQLVGFAKETLQTTVHDNIPELTESAKKEINNYINDTVKTHGVSINLVSLCLTGLAAGAITAGIKSLIDIIKTSNQRSKRKKTTREILKIDNMMYAEDNEIEAEKIKSELTKEEINKENKSLNF